jgi:hypothetical protein
VAQINRKSEGATLTEGERIVVPRYLGQRFARAGAPEAAKPASGEEAPAAGAATER